MARFVPGRPIATGVPQIVVDAGTLADGAHRFTLVVQDDSGRRSDVAEAVVLVGERRFRPGPDILVGPRPRPVVTPQPQPQPQIRPTFRQPGPTIRPT